AFRIEPEATSRQAPPESRPQADAQRKPRAMKTDVAMVIPAEVDVFDEPDIIAAEPPPAIAPRKRSLLGSIFFGAFG
ncbi:MAG: TIGR01620 family protein, partial [Mesorhizobium sp.]